MRRTGFIRANVRLQALIARKHVFRARYKSYHHILRRTVSLIFHMVVISENMIEHDILSEEEKRQSRIKWDTLAAFNPVNFQRIGC